jgi:hypothetical protein
MSTLSLTGVEPKDPGESAIYTMDWTAFLNSGATISTSTWTATGLTVVTSGIVTGNLKTSVKISGGVDGQDYEPVNEIVTSDGETLRRSGVLPVRAR